MLTEKTKQRESLPKRYDICHMEENFFFKGHNTHQLVFDRQLLNLKYSERGKKWTKSANF